KRFGSSPLGNVWSFPSKKLTYDQTLAAMKALTERVAKLTTQHKEYGHPIDLTWALEPGYLQAAAETTQSLGLPEKIPVLCTLVVASPFDAALHAAPGKLHGLNCDQTYSPALPSHEPGTYLGRDLPGEP